MLRPWVVDLEVDEVDELHQLHSGAERAVGELDFQGRTRFQLRKQHMDIEVDELILSQARLESRGEVVAEEMRVELEGRLGPLVPEVTSGRSVLGELDSRLVVEAQVTNLSALRHLLPERTQLEIEGSGNLDVVIDIESGVLRDGSVLALSQGDVEVGFLGYVASGRGDVYAAVDAELGGTSVCAAVSDYQIDRRERASSSSTPSGRPLLRSRNESALWMHAVSDRYDLESGPGETRFRVSVPTSQIDDLNRLAGTLPKLPELAIDAGRGTLSGGFEYDTRLRSGRGQLEVTLDDLRGRYGAKTIAAGLDVDLEISEADLRARRARFDGSRLDLRDVVLDGRADPGDAPWRASVEMKRALVELEGGRGFQADAAVAMTNTGPLISLFSERKKHLNWFKPLLEARDVEGEAELVADARGWRLPTIDIEADHREVRASIDLRSKPAAGALFLRWRRLSAALEIADGERDWKLLRSRRWFEARRGDLIKDLVEGRRSLDDLQRVKSTR